jgi:membrane-bound lytic murein transglycosylase D
MSNRILFLVAALSLGACSGQPVKSDAKAVSAAVTLYARLDAAVGHYEAARADGKGNAESTAARESAALDELQSAATECAAVKGCETQRFFAAFDRLLRLQRSASVVDVAADAAVDGDATTEAGESSPVVAALPETGRSLALLKGRQLSDIIALNDPVKVALQQWLTQYRPNLMQTYENYAYLRHRMWPEYQKAGLPEAVLFGILAKESGGKVHAVSHSGASGPLQFMSATGARFGLGVVDGFDQRFDPALSARANAAYLNEQLALFNDNLELVLGAYNWGEGAMQRLAARQPDASFWSPQVYAELSPETRDYVPMVLAAAWLFLHPERYNLVFPKHDGKPATIVLKRPASIDELTVCLGSDGNSNGWFRTLRNLNPVYEPQQELPLETRIEVPEKVAASYEKLCTSGKWVELAGDLHSAALPAIVEPPNKARTTPPRMYAVKKGETLAGIARKFGCARPGELARLNHLKPPDYAVRAGQDLRVAGCSR